MQQSRTIIGTTGNVFRDGILPIIATGVAPMICILWMAVWIAPRMIHFEGSLTMGDIMGTLYGRHGQVATGVLGFLFTICAVSAQIVALAYVYEFLLGFKSYWAIGLGGLIAVTYASMGGMKAVTTTDVLQFAVLVIVIPMIANVMTHEVGGIKERDYCRIVASCFPLFLGVIFGLSHTCLRPIGLLQEAYQPL